MAKKNDDEAKKAADKVDDVDDAEYKKQLRMEVRGLNKKIALETQMTGLYSDERSRLNYFWLISKKELDDKQAELRNKERELQDLTEKH
jgi:growth arrest-specific protein 8